MVADDHGVSIYLRRIQAITPNSSTTTATATHVASLTSLIKYGSVCPTPPIAVIRPHTVPRAHGCPRPVRLPSPDNASANPMLMPAPSVAANPTQKASQLLCVAKAAANTGASVETEPSMSPASPG